MSSQKIDTIEDNLRKLSDSDAFVFSFYYHEIKEGTLDALPGIKVGSVTHFELLKKIAAEDINLKFFVLPHLKELKHTAFVNKAKKMVSMATEALKAKVNPINSLPSRVTGSIQPSLSATVTSCFDRQQSKKSPECPYSETEFTWYNHNNIENGIRKPKHIRMHGFRALFADVVTSKDITYTWLSENVLEVSFRYPDLMNFPVELCSIIRDPHTGELVLDEQHSAIQGFDRSLEPRRSSDGYVYDKFYVTTDEAQDPNFVPLNHVLNGFDLIPVNYKNADNEDCRVKILQIITREKDEGKVGGKAEETAVAYATSIRGMQGLNLGPTTSTPFGASSKQNVGSPPHYQPASPAVPFPNKVPSMNTPPHHYQQQHQQPSPFPNGMPGVRMSPSPSHHYHQPSPVQFPNTAPSPQVPAPSHHYQPPQQPPFPSMNAQVPPPVNPEQIRAELEAVMQAELEKKKADLDNAFDAAVAQEQANLQAKYSKEVSELEAHVQTGVASIAVKGQQLDTQIGVFKQQQQNESDRLKEEAKLRNQKAPKRVKSDS